MNATLNEPSQQAENAQDIRGPYDTDNPRFPLLIAARIAIEWSRLSGEAGIRNWGSQYWGQPITIENDVWTIGYQYKSGNPTIIVTVDAHKHGGGTKFQKNWEIALDTLKDGVSIETMRAW